MTDAEKTVMTPKCIHEEYIALEAASNAADMLQHIVAQHAVNYLRVSIS